MTTFPVFGSNGQEGELGAGTERTPGNVNRFQGSPYPLPVFRDRAKETEALNAAFDAAAAQANPQLFQAQQARRRAERTVADWQRFCTQLGERVMAGTNHM